MTREKMLNTAFDKVMGAPGMPNESDPDYERWLFDAFVAAIEAAGVRLVPGTLTKDMCMACMYSDQAATGVDRIDYHAVLHRRYAAQLAASPYAQKDETK